eukprot:1159471-Pelagomonas_calceolata.AAC.6
MKERMCPSHPVALATVAISEAKTNEDKAAAFAQLQGILITSGNQHMGFGRMYEGGPGHLQRCR